MVAQNEILAGGNSGWGNRNLVPVFVRHVALVQSHAVHPHLAGAQQLVDQAARRSLQVANRKLSMRWPSRSSATRTVRAPVVGGAWGVGSVIGGMLLWACPSWACCCRA